MESTEKQDLLDKIETLIGLLEMWQRNEKKPPYLNSIIDEAKDFITNE